VLGRGEVRGVKGDGWGLGVGLGKEGIILLKCVRGGGVRGWQDKFIETLTAEKDAEEALIEAEKEKRKVRPGGE
jgi:hypothetical protein